MLGQAPGSIGLEHPVLQNKTLRIRPVVGDVSSVVVAHHVRGALEDAGGIVRIGAAQAAFFDELDKAVHLAPIHVPNRGASPVRTSAVPILGVMVRFNAGSAVWVRNADRRLAVTHWDSIGSRESAEVAVERAVLLHDDNHMPDLVNGILRVSSSLGPDARASGVERP
jgi:hypothetical protein